MLAKVATFFEHCSTLDCGKPLDYHAEWLASGVHVDGSDPGPVFGWLPVEVFVHGLMIKAKLSTDYTDYAEDGELRALDFVLLFSVLNWRRIKSKVPRTKL
jgi:hypothetical protein